MSFLASTVIERARAIWKDPSKILCSDANACLWLSDALLELQRLKPTAFRDDYGNRVDVPDISATTDSINLDAGWRPYLVDYVTGRGFMQDADSQEHKARGNDHFSLFYSRLGIKV